MRIAVLTDIHANREALSACLTHAQQQGASRFAFLGDLVGYGADPAWVLDCIQEYASRGAWVLQGNHDAGVVQGPRQGMNPFARQGIEWTQQQLSQAQREFLASLPQQILWEEILLVHANAWAPGNWEYIDGSIEAARSMQATTAQLTFCGHVHQPGLYHLSLTGKTGEFLPEPEVGIPLSKQRRWLVIPGSVGQPRDGNPAACYAIFDRNKHELTYYRVPYDVTSAAEKIRAAGLPPLFAERLLEGR